jgi:HD-GYP domain-containing protein (c-di-GMP phosphodiesterase class II)
MIGKRSLHEMLVARLVLVAALASIIVGILVVHNERDHVFAVARDRALVRTATLRTLILDQLDASALGEHTEIQKMLQASTYKGLDLSTGHYVFARVLDPALREVAQVTDPSHENVDSLVKYAEAERLRPSSSKTENLFAQARVGGRSYVHALVPLLNSGGSVAAYAEGFFAITKEEEGAGFRNLLRAVGIAVGTVLATSLLLYPVIIRLMRRLARLSHNLLDANLETLNVLGSTIAKRDSDTDVHNFRVTIYAVKIAESLSLTDEAIRILIKGAFLHDVGKIGIRDTILLKPGRLDTAEFAEMKQHVNHGIDIVSRSSWLKEASSVVGCHHEKFEGNGYPDGLSGNDIPLLARIFAVADVFDALTSRRPYKDPLSYEEAIDILLQGRGSHFDPDVLDRFVEIAPPLYNIYGNKDDERPRKDLSEIVARYFTADIAVFLD